MMRASRRLLVVDDHADIASALRDHLADGTGWVVDTAGDAQEARELLERRRYDAVLTDEHMPGERGSALLAWLAQAQPTVLRVLVSSDLVACSTAQVFARKPDLTGLRPLLAGCFQEGSPAEKVHPSLQRLAAPAAYDPSPG